MADKEVTEWGMEKSEVVAYYKRNVRLKQHPGRKPCKLSWGGYFFHLPRTGGMCLTTILKEKRLRIFQSGGGNDHIVPQELKYLWGIELTGKDVTILRRPDAWIVSMWAHSKRTLAKAGAERAALNIDLAKRAAAHTLLMHGDAAFSICRHLHHPDLNQHLRLVLKHFPHVADLTFKSFVGGVKHICMTATLADDFTEVCSNYFNDGRLSVVKQLLQSKRVNNTREIKKKYDRGLMDDFLAANPVAVKLTTR